MLSIFTSQNVYLLLHSPVLDTCMLKFFHFSLNFCTHPKPWQAGFCWFHHLFSIPWENSQSYLWNVYRWMSACYLMCQYWLRQICWTGRKNLRILQLIFIAFKISKISKNSSLWQSLSYIYKLCKILYVYLYLYCKCIVLNCMRNNFKKLEDVLIFLTFSRVYRQSII